MPDPVRPDPSARGLRPLRVAELSRARPTAFDIAVAAAERAALAAELGLTALPRLRLRGTLAPAGRDDWALVAELEAEVEQPCVVTLAPVRTMLREPVERRYVAGLPPPGPGEVEMPADDSLEPLGAEIDLPAVLREALALAVPLYPRLEGLPPLDAAEPEAARRPFAGLAALRNRLGGADGREEG